jgi:hypothetical protein
MTDCVRSPCTWASSCSSRLNFHTIIKATDKDFSVKLLDDGNIEVWHGFTARVIDLKAWRNNHDH